MELVLSATVIVFLIASVIIFLISRRRLDSVENKLEIAEDNYQSEEYSKSLGNVDEAEDIDRKIMESINRLQKVAEERYSTEEVTSYSELQGDLEEASEEDRFAENLLESLNYLENKINKKELTEKDKKLARQAAFSVLRG